jgi:hypothetical protein
MPTPIQQRAFFETYGFIKFPGLVKDEIETILVEFTAVFPQLGIRHDGTKRTMIVPFIDQRAGLCRLLDHPGIIAAATNILGPDYNYLSSDGNYYTGDTTWHRDGFYPTASFIKMAFYLDPVARDTGALRVMPGSHRAEYIAGWRDHILRDSVNEWGVEQRDLPCAVLDSQPGDVLFFNHRLLHAAFGGGSQRRMFTANLGRMAQTPDEIEDLKSYIGSNWSAYSDTPYGTAMLAGGAQRHRHLRQAQEYWAEGLKRKKPKFAV